MIIARIDDAHGTTTLWRCERHYQCVRSTYVNGEVHERITYLVPRLDYAIGCFLSQSDLASAQGTGPHYPNLYVGFWDWTAMRGV